MPATAATQIMSPVEAISKRFPVKVSFEGSTPRFDFIDYSQIYQPGTFNVYPALRLGRDDVVPLVTFDFSLSPDGARFISGGGVVQHRWLFARPGLPKLGFSGVEPRRFTLTWDELGNDTESEPRGPLARLSILTFAASVMDSVNAVRTEVPWIVARNKSSKPGGRPCDAEEASVSGDEVGGEITMKVSRRRLVEPRKDILWFDIFDFDYAGSVFEDGLIYPEPVIEGPQESFVLKFELSRELIQEKARWEADASGDPHIRWYDLEGNEPAPLAADLDGARTTLAIRVPPATSPSIPVSFPLRFETRVLLENGDALDFDPGIFRKEPG